MNKLVTSPPKELIKALDLPEHTTEFSISFKIGELAVVECKYYLHIQSLKPLEEKLGRYRMIEVRTGSSVPEIGDDVVILRKRTDGCNDSCSSTWLSLRTSGANIGYIDKIRYITACRRCKTKLYALHNTNGLWISQDIELVGNEDKIGTRLTRRMDTDETTRSK